MSLIVLCGKTASGKTAVRNELKKKGYQPILTYTTRPKRKGETNKDYNFISEEKFKNGIAGDKFAEYKSYTVATGETWYYGCTKESLSGQKDGVIILTPQGYRDVKDQLPKNHVCIYLYANRSTILDRLKMRGDNNSEIVRRMSADDIDFQGFQNEDGVKVVYNSDDKTIKDVVERIVCIASENIG